MRLTIFGATGANWDIAPRPGARSRPPSHSDRTARTRGRPRSGPPAPSSPLSPIFRADLAHTMLNRLNDPDTERRAIDVAY